MAVTFFLMMTDIWQSSINNVCIKVYSVHACWINLSDWVMTSFPRISADFKRTLGLLSWENTEQIHIIHWEYLWVQNCPQQKQIRKYRFYLSLYACSVKELQSKGDCVHFKRSLPVTLHIPFKII